eukprot:6235562-Karenia_brevis.AAC.1
MSTMSTSESMPLSNPTGIKWPNKSMPVFHRKMRTYCKKLEWWWTPKWPICELKTPRFTTTYNDKLMRPNMRLNVTPNTWLNLPAKLGYETVKSNKGSRILNEEWTKYNMTLGRLLPLLEQSASKYKWTTPPTQIFRT